jgi:hypothetical protein
MSLFMSLLHSSSNGVMFTFLQDSKPIIWSCVTASNVTRTEFLLAVLVGVWLCSFAAVALQGRYQHHGMRARFDLYAFSVM